LEGNFEVLLVNAQHVKAIPGRKTDVGEADRAAQRRTFKAKHCRAAAPWSVQAVHRDYDADRRADHIRRRRCLPIGLIVAARLTPVTPFNSRSASALLFGFEA
jgi:hypothetical protein